jgi:hypothetical protein
MNLQKICEQYAAFRKTLGERFEVNKSQLKAFCRAMGQNLDIEDVSPENVNNSESAEFQRLELPEMDSLEGSGKKTE